MMGSCLCEKSKADMQTPTQGGGATFIITDMAVFTRRIICVRRVICLMIRVR